jgi:hypothetical protein
MKKKEYIILAVIIVLLGSYLFLRNNDRSRYDLPVLPNANAVDITRVDIITAEDALGLELMDGLWLIGENAYPADASRVDEMLSALEKLALTALVSESGAYSAYDLTEDKCIRVQAWEGDRKVRDLVIGKAANTYRHTFVRVGDDPDVYHADGNIRSAFDHNLDSLRDKTALSFSVDDITGIEIVSAGKTRSFILETPPEEITSPSGEVSEKPDSDAPEPIWMTGDGVQADEDALDRLLSQLAYLNCSSYLVGRTKEAFTEPLSTITLTGKETCTLSIYGEEESEGECPAVSSQNNYPFVLNETTCSRLSESIERIFNPESGD